MKNPAFDLLVWGSLRLAPINTTHKTTHSTSLGTRSDRPGPLPAFRRGEEPGYEATKENKKKNMWQSRVEIEGYSITYFDRIAAFEAPYR